MIVGMAKGAFGSDSSGVRDTEEVRAMEPVRIRLSRLRVRRLRPRERAK